MKSKGRYACLLAATLVTKAAWGDSFFYVGPEASADGATLIGRTVEPERMNAAFRTVVRPNVVEREMAYASTPAVSAIRRDQSVCGAVTECGLAVTGGRSGHVLPELLKLDPYSTNPEAITDDNMVGFAAMANKSAKEAVLMVTERVRAKGIGGPATWLFADTKEAWLLELYAGHAWAAVRLPRNQVTAFGDRFMLRGFKADGENALASKNLVELAEKTGTIVRDATGAIDLFRSYSGKADDYGNLRTWRGRTEWAKTKPGDYVTDEPGEPFYEPARKLSEKDVFRMMRDRMNWTKWWPDNTTKSKDTRCFATGRQATAHVLAVRQGLPTPLAATMWVAHGPAEHSVFLPVNAMVNATAADYAYDVTAKSYYYDPKCASHAFRRLAALAEKDRWKLGLDVKGSFSELETEYFTTWPAAVAAAAAKWDSDRKGAKADLTAFVVREQERALHMARWFTEDMLWHIVSQNRLPGDFPETSLGAPKLPRSVTSEPQAWWSRLEYKRREIAASSGRFDLVFVGDSITHFWEDRGKDELAEIQKEFSVLDLGYAGNNTETVLWRLKDAGELSGYKAKVFMVMIGTNNAVTDPPEEIAAGVKAVIGLIRERQPQTKILLLPIFPRGADATDKYRIKNEAANKIIRTFADDKHVFWNDFNAKFLAPDGKLPKELFPDLLHPSAAGYRIWREAVMPQLRWLATGGMCEVDAQPMPKEFDNTNVWARVRLERPFDVGTSANRETQRVVSQREKEKFLIRTVPCEMFTRGQVLCAVSDDPKKERKFTVRITRWNDDNEYAYNGRSKYAMATRLVDFDQAPKRKVGEVTLDGKKVPLWLVETPLDLGDIQDIVNTDNRGNFLKELGRYLDFEVCGPLLTRVSALNDRTMNTDPERVSAITVYGAWLERPAAEFAMRWIRPGNVFHNDEKPETKVDLKVNRPGEYILSWVFTASDGSVCKTAERRFSAAEKLTVDLSLSDDDWYRLDWKLADAKGQTLMTHRAAFALLGKDTRQSEYGEGPYATWGHCGAHYHTPRDEFEYNVELIHKLGVRKEGRYPHFLPMMKDEAFRRKWKLGGASLESTLHRAIVPVMKGEKTEEDLAKELQDRLDHDPNCTHVQLYWESYHNNYGHAPEITGGTFDPKTELPGAAERGKVAAAACKFMRKHFPRIPITIGNTLACSEFIAELARNGVTEDMADYMGLEIVGRANLPERENNVSIQSADLFRELAPRIGRSSWKPGSGLEINYRRDTFLGEDLQAEYYARDVLLSLCWRFPLISIAGLCDAGNHYIETPWGNCALCHRYPYLYPKKSYAAYATLTKVLDRVTDAKPLATGDDCVYAVEFPRKDGKSAYAFWTTTGTAAMTAEVAGDFELTAAYGRKLKPEVKGGRLSIAVSGAPTYLAGAAGCVKNVTVGSQAYPEAKVPADYRVAVKTDDASKWQIVKGKVEGIHKELGSSFPCRVPARKVTLSSVQDEDFGKCIEIALPEPDLTLPNPVMECAVLELKKPVALKGDPMSLGAKVKGNSGWGRIYWIIEGADGKRTFSTGHNGWGGDYDDGGKMSICFSGWKFLSYPMDERSSIRDYTINCVGDLWYEPVTYPAKLVGFAFAAESRPLFLATRRPKEQKIRLAEIGFFD